MVSTKNLPVRFIMDRDIIEDFVYEDDNILTKEKMIIDQMRKTKNGSNYNIAVLEKDTNKVSGIIDCSRIKNIIRILEDKKDLAFRYIASSVYTINQNDPFDKALTLFETHNTNNILLVTDDNDRYAGRLIRTKVREYAEELSNLMR